MVVRSPDIGRSFTSDNAQGQVPPFNATAIGISSNAQRHPSGFLPRLSRTGPFDLHPTRIALDRLWKIFAQSKRAGDSPIDDFERSYSVRWLTSLVRLSEFSQDDSYAQVIDSAASLLAICCGASASGNVVKMYEFAMDQLGEQIFQVSINDGSINSHDHPGAVGMQTWGSASVLGRAIASDPSSYLPVLERPLRVLELGSGTGLLSLVIANVLARSPLRSSFSATIFATDYDPIVLDNLQANIMRNSPYDDRVSLSSHFLDWQSFVPSKKLQFSSTSSSPSSSPISLPHFASEESASPFSEPFDVIVGADVVYEPHQASWLKATVEALLRRPTLPVPKPNGFLENSSDVSGSKFHLVMPLRSTHQVESASVTNIFPHASALAENARTIMTGGDGLAYQTSKPVLAIVAQEEIEVEDEKDVRRTVRYMRYEIGWVSTPVS